MNDYIKAKELLKQLYELSESQSIRDRDTDEEIDYKDLQDLYREPLVELIDLLGMEDIYLGKEA